ncbi:hypothetical protein Goklo_017711 [Gossypium klotzschianum]|uniref:Aminotransferase-like plant mobile domain-containing protein n=1 Tax=Gossypium klotzschianum TaxID=34286 RepID=A0A7J8UII1_9ROSI|nr:hypothetical protein [Gossypium klotzschianum]
MEKGFLDKVEDNAVVRIWSEKTEQEKGDSLTEGYICFTFGKVDLVLTIEECTTLLCYSRIQVDKAYSRAANVPTFLKRLMSITGMSKQWVTARIKQKGDGEGRFIRCAQLLLAWFHSHFWKVKKVSYRVFSENYSSLKEFMATLDFDWDPLFGIWGVFGYAILLVLRQYRLRQFIPVTQGLAQCEFMYKCDNYKKKVHEISNA